MATTDCAVPMKPAAQTEMLPTRWSLLTRLKDWDDAEGWKEFFDTYWRLIYAVATKAGLSDAEAQDVVQETVIAVAKQMPGFRCDPAVGSFKGWLLRITACRVTDRLRRRSRQPDFSVSREGQPSTRTSTVERLPDTHMPEIERLWEQEWEQHLLETALAQLRRHADPAQYQMFELHVVRGFPVEEVARRLKVKAAQVYFAKYKLSVALKRQVRRLSESGV